MAVAKIELELTARIDKATDALNKMSTSTKNASNSSKGLNTDLKDISRSTQKLAGSFNNVGSIISTSLGFGSLQQALRTTTDLMLKGFTAASQYIENFNLFNVSMQGNIEDALKYQYQLNRAFSIDMSNSMRYQGFFQNLASALGLANEESLKLSTNLTNLTYDLSSLYNIDFNTMYIKLQSGIVGQTKPLRSIGIDVTQQTLQPYLYEMGINKKVTELTQAEKVILRYIAILKQSTNAQGDFARTLASPANQIRIMKDQMAELTRWFGTLFIGVAGKVLPYINAIVISLKEAFKWLSKVFGFDVADYDYLTASDDIGLIDDALSDASESSDELQKSLAGFDELNVLSDNTSAQEAFNISGVTSTYATLVDYMEDYDNMLDKVKNKAQEIADKILEMVGFQGQLNDVTGEYEWIWTGVKNIDWGSIFKGLWDLYYSIFDWWWEFEHTLYNAQADLGDGIVRAFGDAFGYVYSEVTGFISNLFSIFFMELNNQWYELKNMVASIINGWIDGINNMISKLNNLPAVNIQTIQPVVVTQTVVQSVTQSNGTVTTSTGGTAAKYTAPTTSVSTGTSIANKLAKYSSIGLYADGGFPASGELFIAREAGAEMVGSIGGKTAVANNQDIVAAIAQGVSMAMSSAMNSGGQTVELIVDDTTFGRVVINSANKVQKNTNLKLQTY